MVPYAPRFRLNNQKTVFFGEILSHDAFLRVLKAYTRQRSLDLLMQAVMVFHYATPHMNADGSTTWWPGAITQMKGDES